MAKWSCDGEVESSHVVMVEWSCDCRVESS